MMCPSLVLSNWDTHESNGTLKFANTTKSKYRMQESPIVCLSAFSKTLEKKHCSSSKCLVLPFNFFQFTFDSEVVFLQNLLLQYLSLTNSTISFPWPCLWFCNKNWLFFTTVPFVEWFRANDKHQTLPDIGVGRLKKPSPPGLES